MAVIHANLDSIYKKSGYLARYGGDIYIVVFTIIFVTLVVFYFAIMNRIKPLRANWVKERCNPSVVPFAGLVYKPPGKTAFQATADNFAECGQKVTRDLTNRAVQPLYYIMNNIADVFKIVVKGLQGLRGAFDNIRSGFAAIIGDIFSRISAVMIPLQHMIIAFKTAVEKINGIGATIVYGFYGYYLGLKSLIGSIVEIMITFLVMFTALILVLWVIPFTWPAAALALAVWIPVAALLIYVIVVYSQAMNASSKKKMPKKPTK
jgi:hypothetical protein